MALQVDRKELDEFCPQLFRALDGLGLLPLHLWAKPNEFEKYPRLLFGSVQRYNDVETGFREWESRVLRDAPYRKEERYPDLEVLRQWMVKNGSVFTKSANMQHLRTSLYARVFQYLYPRRVLVKAYCMKHQGNVGAIEPEFLAGEMAHSLSGDLQKLQETYQEEWDTIVADAQASLNVNAGYYRKVLAGKESITLLEEVLAEEMIETEKLEEVQS